MAEEFTYDLKTDVGKVRRDISDKDPTDYQFTDAELQSWVDETSNVKAACGLALRSWASSLSREDKRVKSGSWEGDMRDVVKEMLTLAEAYLEEAGYVGSNSAPSFRSAAIDWSPTVQSEREIYVHKQ